jgi:hypothetical protein
MSKPRPASGLRWSTKVSKEAICLMTTVKLMLACKQVQECNQSMLQLSLLKTLGLKDQI